MEDFIDRARARETQQQLEIDARENARRDAQKRLKLAFPEWLDSLIVALEKYCGKLVKAYPEDLRRNYAVVRTSAGCIARCQSQSGISLDVEFSTELQTITVKHIGSWSDVPVQTNRGNLGIADNADVFVEYQPHVPGSGVSYDPYANKRYGSSELLAHDLMQELTRL